MIQSTKSRPKKPAKPYPDFPLFPHATRRWAKKIRGKLHYFGPWEDPDGALNSYLEAKDYLHAGKTPPQHPDGLTIRELCNQFLTSKRHLVDTGELATRTWHDYHATCEKIIEAFGRERLVDDLSPVDFEKLLSANPTLVTDPERYNGPARPEILAFSVSEPKAPPKVLLPTWEGTPPFTEHSYRSFAADGPNGELIMFQDVGYTHAEWAFLDRDGRWTAQGKLVWPWGAEYDKPQPIRVCYPNVALVDRAVYFCGVSDIVEPYQKWREYKEKLTGRKWDYDFRRLFFTWSDDITTGKFHEWVEIASRDKTCGWISPGDLWVAPDGAVHILWTERAIDTRLRDKFFPDTKQSHSLNYAVVREGKVLSRQTLLLSEEGRSNEIPGRGRFQVTPEGRLFVFCYISGTGAGGQRLSENRLMELYDDRGASGWVKVPMKHPMRDCFTATVRAGSPPSRFLELLGHRADEARTISYARVRLW